LVIGGMPDKEGNLGRERGGVVETIGAEKTEILGPKNGLEKSGRLKRKICRAKDHRGSCASKTGVKVNLC